MVFVEGCKLTYLAAVVVGLLVLSFGVVAHALEGRKIVWIGTFTDYISTSGIGHG